MAKEKSKWLTHGVEYYPESGTLLLIRCPKCGRENWAPQVASGTCAWCGYDGHELFVKYCCGGIDKPEDEMPHYVKVCCEVFTNGYKAGYQDMLRNVTGKEWEK